MEKQDSF